MTREAIADLFDRRTRAYNEHNIAAFMSMYAEDAVVESPLGGTHQGRAAIGAVIEVFIDAVNDAAWSQDVLLIDGDVVVQVCTISGTDTGGLMGVAPSGRPVQLPVVFVCRLRDGLIVHERRIYDFTGLLVQVGVLRARPA